MFLLREQVEEPEWDVRWRGVGGEKRKEKEKGPKEAFPAAVRSKL